MPEPILNLQLAQAERLHTEATEAHQDAAKALQNITSVIANKQNQRAAITTARLAGTATAQDAAEYSAIAGDLEVLENMRADAAQVLAQAAPKFPTSSA
jgi:DNA repair exonuclease SbcCD ATPase subunit